MEKFGLSLTPGEAAVMWRAVVGTKARILQAATEACDVGERTPEKLRKLADEVEFLNTLAPKLAVWCRSQGVEVGF